MKVWNRGPVTRRSGARGRAVSLVLAVLAAGCTAPDRTLGPEGFAALGGGPVTSFFDIVVVTPDGQSPVKKATVRVYGIRPDQSVGPIATGLTDVQGFVRFDLAPGAYCVSARLSPPEWLSLDVITPPQPLSYTEIGTPWGPVVSVPGVQVATGGSGPAWVPFSPPDFTSCYTDLPLAHVEGGTSWTAPLAQPYYITPEVLDLNGQPLTGIDVFAVLPVTVPWRTPEDPEVKTAFFSIVDRTASPANVVVSPNAPYALEFQQPYMGFNITGTSKGMGGGPGGTLAFPWESAPLLCQQTLETFPSGERGIDFLQVNFGYHATLALEPDASIVAVQLQHRGDGPVTATFRTDLPNGRLTTTVDYDCADGNCGPATVKTPGKNAQSVQVFHMAKPGGIIKTTLVLMDIPTGHRRVLFAAKSPGDKIPLTSRDVATDAFFILEAPARCSVLQSNDDKWVVGDL